MMHRRTAGAGGAGGGISDNGIDYTATSTNGVAGGRNSTNVLFKKKKKIKRTHRVVQSSSSWTSDRVLMGMVLASLCIVAYIVTMLTTTIYDNSSSSSNSQGGGGSGSYQYHPPSSTSTTTNSDSTHRGGGEGFLSRINTVMLDTTGLGFNRKANERGRRAEEQQQRYHNKRAKVGRGAGMGNNNMQGDDQEPVGDFSKEYYDFRQRYTHIFGDYENPEEDPEAVQRRLEFVKTMRKRSYKPISSDFQNSQTDCPDYPPDDYPLSWPIMDIITHWNPDDVTPRNEIYQGICVFDATTEYHKAINYRKAEVPFVIRDDPKVLKTVERWNYPGYLEGLLGEEEHRSEYSHNNHFMYWMIPRGGGKQNKRRRGGGPPKRQAPPGWSKPTELIKMSYPEWISKANSTKARRRDYELDRDHWYFRLIGCGRAHNCDKISSEFLFDELEFFKPEKDNLYIVEPSDQRGIHCRFGMTGVIAENHFDGSRNMIALMGGERRYILSHPDQCEQLALLPKEHPSGRHSAVDWSNPDLVEYPQFRKALGNEIVLQAGDVLYLPTHWFHYIVSLELNFQCNTRSGISDDYHSFIRQCGF